MINRVWEKWRARIHLPKQQDALQTFRIESSHVFLVSYPKSGNTWIRFLLANILSRENEPIIFQKVGEYIPDGHRIEDIEIMNNPRSTFNMLPRQIIKSHSTYTKEFHSVIYLARDGRDVLTSYYHWINARRSEHVMLPDIIRGEIPFGLWSEHVLGWINGQNSRKLIIRYEDILENPERQLEVILSFLDLEVDRQLILRSIRSSSLENMRKLEKQYGVFGGHNEAIKKVPFVRKGTSGDWRNLFAQSDLDLFWQYHQEGMTALNYRC